MTEIQVSSDTANPEQNNQKITLFIIFMITIIGIFIVAWQKKEPITPDVDLNQATEPKNQPIPTELKKENEENSLAPNNDQDVEPDNNYSLTQTTGAIQGTTDSQPLTSTEQPMNKTNMTQPEMVIDSTKNYMATMVTNQGTIKLQLFADKTPITVNNFVYLARNNFYNDTIFHRVIPNFMVQGGDPLGNGTGGPGYQFQDEQNSDPLVAGSLAMANSGPNTNGSQFFIVTASATSWLDGLHTNFGKVVEGMEVVKKIEAIQTGTNDKPVSDVIIQSMTISEN